MKKLQEFYKPGQANPDVVDRKAIFARLNELCAKRGGGWLTSVPGEREVRMEVLEGSTLPAEIRKLGYDVVAIGEGQRILPHAVRQEFVQRADGQLELLTEGSTRPITTVVTGAGIARVMRYSFDLP